MRLIKGSLVGMVLAGILAITPTVASARGGGGGSHFGGFARQNVKAALSARLICNQGI